MYSKCLILFAFIFFECVTFSIGDIYYAIKPTQQDKPPLYGNIYAYNSESTTFQFYSNFSFDIRSNDTYLYYFVTGPIAVTNNSLSTIYFPIQCATSFERLILIAYNMKTKTYHQSQWIVNNGIIHFLHYDPFRQRLIGLRDENTFKLIIEEYSLRTLEVNKKYTEQEGEKYAFPYVGCSIFDYEENWIVQVRTRFEQTRVNAYYIKMDLNLVGNKSDIVTKFYLLPNVGNLCSMTYDIETKTALVTWQHGSIDKDLLMMYMNPYTGVFTNETLLLETGSGFVIESTEAIYNEKEHQILFMIYKENQMDSSSENWMVLVEFHTMKILEKKPVDSIPAFSYWEYFYLENN